jgi:hypothetical protein
MAVIFKKEFDDGSIIEVIYNPELHGHLIEYIDDEFWDEIQESGEDQIKCIITEQSPSTLRGLNPDDSKPIEIVRIDILDLDNI